MSHSENRDAVIDRVKRELIGPGSDIFLPIDGDINQEVIAEWPLQRYFSGILFPRESKKPEDKVDGETAESSNNDSGDTNDKLDDFEDSASTTDANDTEQVSPKSVTEVGESPEIIRNNTFFPSQIGFSFCLAKGEMVFDIVVNFGLYTTAKYNEIQLPFFGETDLYEKLSTYIEVDRENKVLKLKKDIKEHRNVPKNEFKGFYNTEQYKHIEKLFFKPWQNNKRLPYSAKIKVDLGQNLKQEILLDEYLGTPLPEKLKGMLFVKITSFSSIQ
jgi:hypothetical protein